MVVRNAFDGVATNSWQRRLAALLTFPRDSSQRQIVTVTGQSNLGGIQWANGGAYANYYAFGAPNSVDAREQQKAATRAQIQQVRTARWSVT